MKLRDRVRITDLDVKTDHPPVGYISKLWVKFKHPDFQQDWAVVEFDKNLIDYENRLGRALGITEGVPRLAVEVSRLERVE